MRSSDAIACSGDEWNPGGRRRVVHRASTQPLSVTGPFLIRREPPLLPPMPKGEAIADSWSARHCPARRSPRGARRAPSPRLARRRRRRVGKTVPVERHPVCPGVGPGTGWAFWRRVGAWGRVGGPPPLVVAASLAGRAAGDECGGDHPRLARGVFLGACRVLGLAPSASLWGGNPENSVSLPFPRCGLESQFGGPLDHQASARVGCLPFGMARPPGTPRCAVLARGDDPPEPPAALCWPGGTTPRNPPLRSAPARWYFADTPATRPGTRPGLAGPVTIVSPYPAWVLADTPAARPGTRLGLAGPVTIASPYPAWVLAGAPAARPGTRPGLAGPVTIACP